MRRWCVGILMFVVTAVCAAYYAPQAAQASEWTVLELNIDGDTQLYYAEGVNLYINGRLFTHTDMPPIVLDNRIYLPVKDVMERLGAQVIWNTALGQVRIEYEGRRVSLRANSPYINVEGELFQLALIPKNVNGRLMVPAIVITEVFQIEMNWDEVTRTLTLDNGKPLVTPTPEPNDKTIIYVDDDLPSLVFDSGHYNDSMFTFDENADTGPVTLERSMDANDAPLPAGDYPKTELISVEHAEDNPQAFYLKASGAISKVDKFVLPDNRLVLDIYNCEKVMEQSEISIQGSNLLSKLRIGQNQVIPEYITRVVFDLNEPVSFSVTFADDRKTIIVSLLRNEITDVAFDSDGQYDFVRIKGRLTPVVNIFPQTVDGVIIVDIPLGQINQPSEIPANGVFVSGVRTEQFAPATARVLIDTKEEASYSVSYEGEVTVIRLLRPTYQNIAYDSATSILTIPKSALNGADISRITHSDEYLEYQYAFIMPGDYSGSLGEGMYVIKDKYISHIVVETKGGRTSIRFFQQRIMAYDITEDANNIYINVMLPKEKYDKIVVIDAGHGGDAPGRVAGTLVEKEINLDIARRTAALLERNNIKVYMTRTGDTNPTWQHRAAFANELGDLFISMHNNSVDSSSAHGSETFYRPHASDAYIGITSERVSEIILKNIVRTLGTTNRGSKNDQALLVLTLTEIPAVLCEFAFMSNPGEAAKLRTEAFRQLCADAVYKGVMEVFQEYKPRR